LPSADTTRVNQAAVTAVRAVIGPQANAETAADIVEAVRPHIERPYQLALEQAQREIAALKAASISA